MTHNHQTFAGTRFGAARGCHLLEAALLRLGPHLHSAGGRLAAWFIRLARIGD